MSPSKAQTSKAPVSSVKSKAKAKGSKSALGAPSQHNQSSRKGKKAWRKNVDIEDVEEVLEEIRTEERVVGTALHKTQDSDLFQVDLKGDEQLRKSLPRFSSSQLTSAKILAQRSAVPAVFSRPSSSQKRKHTVSKEDKEKLLRIAKKPRKGPFNSVLDPSEYASGSGVTELSEAVKKSGTYDPWSADGEDEEAKRLESLPDGLEKVQKTKPKAPVLQKTKDLIATPAVAEPHQGASYNPRADAHTALILKAAEVEEKRLREAERNADVKAKMEKARAVEDLEETGVARGMTVQPIEDGADEEVQEGEKSEGSAKLPERKTKQQRSKAARLLAEKRALAEKASKKKLLASINDAKSIRKATTKLAAQREEEKARKAREAAEKLKTQGLAGTKLGKHKVPEGEVEVQLGEDLSENLRGLKPEGNLFRDRFTSLQQRALIEPRVRVLPKKRRLRTVEYEKHAWKRFV